MKQTKFPNISHTEEICADLLRRKPSPAFRETVFGGHSGLIAHNLLQDCQRLVELSIRNGQRIKEADHVAVLAADQQQQALGESLLLDRLRNGQRGEALRG